MKQELKEIKKKLRRDKVFKARLKALYDESARNLERALKSYVLAYDDIKLEENFRLASKKDIDDLRREIEDLKPRVDDEARLMLSMVYFGRKMTNSKFLENVITIHTIKLADAEIKETRTFLEKELFREAKRQSELLGLPKVKAEKVKKSLDAILNSENYKATFSDRIWKDQTELRTRLIRNLNTSISRGVNPRVFAKNLRDLVRDDYKNANYAAERIAITESARMQIDLQEIAFKEQGVKHWMWIAEPTACDECANLDGEIFEVGTTDPLPGYIHPFCRCSRAMVD